MTTCAWRRTIVCSVAWSLMLAVAGHGTATAASCTEVLLKRGGLYRCSAVLDTGGTVEYCLKLRAIRSGPGGAEFDTASEAIGTKQAFEQRCTCGAKGRGARAKFAQDAAYLCLDDGTNTVTFGKFVGKKTSGQTYNLDAKVRTVFQCVVDPTCRVCNNEGQSCLVHDDCCAGTACFDAGPGFEPFCKPF